MGQLWRKRGMYSFRLWCLISVFLISMETVLDYAISILMYRSVRCWIFHNLGHHLSKAAGHYRTSLVKWCCFPVSSCVIAVLLVCSWCPFRNNLILILTLLSTTWLFFFCFQLLTETFPTSIRPRLGCLSVSCFGFLLPLWLDLSSVILLKSNFANASGNLLVPVRVFLSSLFQDSFSFCWPPVRSSLPFRTLSFHSGSVMPRSC